MATKSDDATAWKFARVGWVQLHDERGALLGIFETRADAEAWVRRRGDRLRIYRLGYWFVTGEQMTDDVALLRQRRLRLRKTECGNIHYLPTGPKPRRKGGAR